MLFEKRSMESIKGQPVLKEKTEKLGWSEEPWIMFKHQPVVWMSRRKKVGNGWRGLDFYVGFDLHNIGLHWIALNWIALKLKHLPLRFHHEHLQNFEVPGDKS